MATRKPSPDRDQRRQKEIANEFRRLQGEQPPLPAPDVVRARRRKYQPLRLPSRLEDGQYVELSNDLSDEMLPKPPAISSDTRFAAERLLEAVVHVATGKGLVPRAIPVRADRVWTSKHMHAGATDGMRQLFDSDCRNIRKAFTILFGVPPERYWEVVLELVLRDALALRHILPERPAIYTRRGAEVGRTPDRPNAVTILRVVGDRALPGTVPAYLTTDMIDIALAKCTDGRGGGRGTGKKVSVRQWIVNLKKKAEMVSRKTRGQKKP